MEEILEVAPIVIPVEVSQATQEALTDNKMTIGKVEDTVIVTATEDIFLAATSYLGFITEVEVTIPEGTQITSSDKEVFPIENLEVVSTDDATLISEETQKQEQFVSE